MLYLKVANKMMDGPIAVPLKKSLPNTPPKNNYRPKAKPYLSKWNTVLGRP